MAKGFETWLRLTNSGTSAAIATLRNTGGQGVPAERTVSIPPEASCRCA